MATGMATGAIMATGTPGVATSIRMIRVDSDVTTLRVTASQGDIGLITVGGGAQGLIARAAGGISEIDVVDGLGASRIRSQGDVGTISVGSMGDVLIRIGVASTVSSTVASAAGFSNPNATLGILHILGTTQAGGH